MKIGFIVSKLHPHVKVTLKSAKSGVFGMLHTDKKRFVKREISVLFLDLELWKVLEVIGNHGQGLQNSHHILIIF